MNKQKTPTYRSSPVSRSTQPSNPRRLPPRPLASHREERSMPESSSKLSQSTAWRATGFSHWRPLLPLFADSAAHAVSFAETRAVFGQSAEIAANAGATCGLIAGVARHVLTANIRGPAGTAISDLAEIGIHVAIARSRANNAGSTVLPDVAGNRTLVAALGAWSGGKLGRWLGDSEVAEIAGRAVGGYLANRFVLVHSG
jgi:hypothetical protein